MPTRIAPMCKALGERYQDSHCTVQGKAYHIEHANAVARKELDAYNLLVLNFSFTSNKYRGKLTMMKSYQELKENA